MRACAMVCAYHTLCMRVPLFFSFASDMSVQDWMEAVDPASGHAFLGHAVVTRTA